MTKEEAIELKMAYKENSNLNKEVKDYIKNNPIPAYKRNPKISKY